MCYFWVYWILWLLFVFLDHLWLFVGVICSWSLVSLCTHLCVWQQWRTCYTKNTVSSPAHMIVFFSDSPVWMVKVFLSAGGWECTHCCISCFQENCRNMWRDQNTNVHITEEEKHHDLRGKSPHRNWAGVREEHTHCGLLPLLFGLFSL